jgi:signal transduction histidine kinase
LFELSRLDAGVEDFQPEPYPLEDLIVEKLQSFALQFEQKKLQVTVQMPDHSPVHGGSVGVESVKGQGSRFWFTLPKVHLERGVSQ